MSKVVVAAVQAAPILLDRAATLDKLVSLAEKAAGDGAQLVVFPETFVPGYPDWVARTLFWDDAAAQLYGLLLEQSVLLGSSATDLLAATAARLGVWLAVGVDEREPNGSTIYNTLLYFAPDGSLAGRHRKLMPTSGERLVWGMGDGSMLPVLDTGLGRLSGLICWENYMPLARAALYAQGVDIYLAPTWDDQDSWVASMRHIAKEGRLHVIGVNCALRASDLPVDLPGREAIYTDADEWLSHGRSVIVGPSGDVLAGPAIDREETLLAELDITAARRSRQFFDPVGHYSRPDVFHLTVDTTPRPGVTFTTATLDTTTEIAQSPE